jgi:hypothetical protein
MKTAFRSTIALACILLFILLVPGPAKAQENKAPADSLNAMPADVLAIVKKGCFDCHSEPGRIIALTHVNLTKWNEYTADKQAAKARAMCEQLTKGDMPPKRYRENNPVVVPTPEELKILCDWAERLPGK